MAKEKIELFSYETSEIPNAISEIGNLQRDRVAIVSKYDTQISDLQNELAEQTEEIDKKIKKLSLSVKKYFDSNKTKYIKEDTKTVRLQTGDVSYRKGKPSVKTKSSQKLIDSILEKNELSQTRDKFEKKMKSVFIRTKLELNKEAILESQQTAIVVTGVEIDEGSERFYIKPYNSNTELELVD